jgi:uncharacterized pyridoxamine 5'-phosphate oxidase family protein
MVNRKMKGRKLLVLFLCLLLAGCSLAQPAQEKEMSNLEFFQSLNYDDGLSVLEAVFDRFGMQYATTLGLDGAPQIRPIEFKFEKDGVLYFDTVTFYTSYYELQNYPYIQICIGDQETMSYVRLSGKVNFTQDEEVIERCFEESPVLTSQFGNKKEVVIGYYLSDVTMEFRSFEPTLSNYDYKLPTPYDSEEEE